MKKAVILVLCFLIPALAGCAATKKNVPPPKPPDQTDTYHLTSANNGLTLIISRNLRPLPGPNIYTKEGFDPVSILVKLENNTGNNINVSPDFVTLKTGDGVLYKYSPSLTKAKLGTSSFDARSIPTGFQSGGLMVFEVKKGAIADSLTYKDNSNHQMTIKFPAPNKTDI